MAGGVYITHADVEAWLGVTLSGSTSPTDSHVDNLCVIAEGLAASWIYPVSLSTLNGRDSEALKAVLVELVVHRLREWDSWNKAGGEVASEGHSFPASRSYNELIQALRTMCRGSFANVKMID